MDLERARSIAAKLVAHLCQAMCANEAFLRHTISEWLSVAPRGLCSIGDLYDALLRRPVLFEARVHNNQGQVSVTLFLFGSHLPMHSGLLEKDDRDVIALLIEFFRSKRSGGSIAASASYSAFYFPELFEENHPELRVVLFTRLTLTLLLHGLRFHNMRAMVDLVEGAVRRVQMVSDGRALGYCREILTHINREYLEEEVLDELTTLLMPHLLHFVNI